MVRFLTEAGSEKDRPDQSGFTPLHLAAQNGRMKVVVQLCELRPKMDTLQTADEEGHIEVVRFLTEGYSGYRFVRCKGQECLGTYDRNHSIVEGFLTFSATLYGFVHLDFYNGFLAPQQSVTHLKLARSGIILSGTRTADADKSHPKPCRSTHRSISPKVCYHGYVDCRCLLHIFRHHHGTPDGC